ncbi:hypothetical protein LTR39_003565, partial [Cryomyces antarcticus]
IPIAIGRGASTAGPQAVSRSTLTGALALMTLTTSAGTRPRTVLVHSPQLRSSQHTGTILGSIQKRANHLHTCQITKTSDRRLPRQAKSTHGHVQREDGRQLHVAADQAWDSGARCIGSTRSYRDIGGGNRHILLIRWR